MEVMPLLKFSLSIRLKQIVIIIHLKLLNRISQNYLATKDIPCRFIIILLLNICSLVGVTSLKLLK